MILKITDGTTTADLSNTIGGAAKYAVAESGWVPSIAALRRSTLGGRGPYDDVAEEIPVMVFGSSAATVLTNLAVLSRLLDQAERWSRGEAVNAVLLQYQPDGGAQLLQCLVLGRPDVESPGMILPPTFHRKLNSWLIDSVAFRFVRSGLWIGAAETPATSGSTNAPAVASVTFSETLALPGPLRVQLATSLTAHYTSGFLVVANNNLRIQVVEAESLDTTKWTDETEAGTNAGGGHILRYTPTDTAPSACIKDSSSLPSTCRQMALLAAVRNNSTTRNYHLQISVNGLFGTVVGAPVLIDTSSTAPRLISLGMVSLAGRLDHIGLQATVDRITGSGALDIDYLVAVDVSEDQGRVLTFDTRTDTTLTALVVDARLLTSLTPLVCDRNAGSDAIGLAYGGDARLMVSGAKAAISIMATDTVTPANWKTGQTMGDYTLTATRYAAHLTPQ